MLSRVNLYITDERERFFLNLSKSIECENEKPSIAENEGDNEDVVIKSQRKRTVFSTCQQKSGDTDELKWIQEVRSTGQFFPRRLVVRPSIKFGNTYRSKNAAVSKKSPVNQILIRQ